jgi:hypothetical protein
MAHKPHRITWPLTPKSVEDMERMFKDLYEQVQQLQDASGATADAVALTRVVVRN